MDLEWKLINTMEHSPSWEANGSSDSQETPPILRHLKVCYHIHKNPPPVPILSHIYPAHKKEKKKKKINKD
jgi:hypothetical protein